MRASTTRQRGGCTERSLPGHSRRPCCCSALLRAALHSVVRPPALLPACREVVLFFGVVNEVHSLYANVNAQAMGFTTMEGEQGCWPFLFAAAVVVESTRRRLVGWLVG